MDLLTYFLQILHCLWCVDLMNSYFIIKKGKTESYVIFLCFSMISFIVWISFIALNSLGNPPSSLRKRIYRKERERFIILQLDDVFILSNIKYNITENNAVIIKLTYNYVYEPVFGIFNVNILHNQLWNLDIKRYEKIITLHTNLISFNVQSTI